MGEVMEGPVVCLALPDRHAASAIGATQVTRWCVVLVP